MKMFLYESDRFTYILDTHDEFQFDDEDKYEIPEDLVQRYKAIDAEFEAIQDELRKIYKKGRVDWEI